MSDITETIKKFLNKQIEFYTAEQQKTESEFTNVFDFHHDTNKAKAIVDTYNGYLVALNKTEDENQFVFETKINSENKTKQLVEKRKTIKEENLDEIIYYKSKGLLNGLISAEKNIGILMDELDIQLAKDNFKTNIQG